MNTTDKNNNDVLAATMQGIIPIIGAAFLISIPFFVYFSEKGWYAANKAAHVEKEKYISMTESLQQKLLQLDQKSKESTAIANEAEKTKQVYESKEKQLLQAVQKEKDLVKQEANRVAQEFAKKEQVLQVKLNKLEESKNVVEGMRQSAEQALRSAKTLEQDAEKQFMKNRSDGDNIVKVIDDLQSKTLDLNKNCENYDKTTDPFFIDVIQKRMIENYKKLAEAVKKAKDINSEFNNGKLKKIIDLADAELAKAIKKLK